MDGLADGMAASGAGALADVAAASLGFWWRPLQSAGGGGDDGW